MGDIHTKAAGTRRMPSAKADPTDQTTFMVNVDTLRGRDKLHGLIAGGPIWPCALGPGAIVKWDHATMAWWNLGFKSPWLQSTLHLFAHDGRPNFRVATWPANHSWFRNSRRSSW